MQNKLNKPVLVQYVEDRVKKKNKNFAMLFVGQTGSGKSYSALKLGEILDPTFNIDRVCFKASRFMKVINELVEQAKNGENIAGKVVLWDEFGVEHNAREFMTIANRVINYFFQTSRHYNLVIIVTTPFLSFIDSATRKLMHAVAEMQGINQREKTATIKVRMLQSNVMSGKEYPKYLRYRQDNHIKVNSKLKLGLPSEELRTKYEEKKVNYTSEMYKDIMETLESKEKKKEIKQTRYNKPLTDFQKKILELMNKGVKKQSELAKILNVNPARISLNIKFIRNRGYALDFE